MYSTPALLKRFSNVRTSACFGNSTRFQFEKVLNDFWDRYRQSEIAVTMNHCPQILKFRSLPLEKKLFKDCVRYFLSNFYFSPNDSLSKNMKNVFYFIEKAFSVLEIFKFLYFRLLLFFSLSSIAVEIDPRKILKFMTSSTV